MLNRLKNFFGKNFPKNFQKTFRTARTGNSFLLKTTNFGKVNVECDLVRCIVERAANEIEGIQEVDVIVKPPMGKYSLDITFSVSLLQGYSAQNTSDKLFESVKRIMKDSFDLTDVGVNIKINAVVEAPKQKSRRVR